jgi:hypothetical protein
MNTERELRLRTLSDSLSKIFITTRTIKQIMEKQYQ